MIDKRKNAKKSRKKDLDDKYLACDPLPDPENEKDLTDVNASESYQQIGHKDELLSENDILEMSHKAERNDTGFTNFIRFTHEDYQRVLRQCL